MNEDPDLKDLLDGVPEPEEEFKVKWIETILTTIIVLLYILAIVFTILALSEDRVNSIKYKELQHQSFLSDCQATKRSREECEFQWKWNK